jgi:VWFA-related protein
MISDNQGMPVNKHSEHDAIVQAQEAGAIFYGIQVRGESDPPRLFLPTDILSKKLMQAFRKTGNMKKFASETGGAVIPADQPADLGPAFAELMQRVATQYYLGYLSTNPRRDNAVHKIEVRLSKEGRKRLSQVNRIEHRRAYIASASP